MPAQRLGWPVLLAVTLALPTLSMGLIYDDWIQKALVLRAMTHVGPWELFTFATGEPERLRPYIEQGPFPWYTLSELKIQFFRPLAAALIQADVRLFGDASWAMHAHSLAWRALDVLAALWVFRKIAPRLAPLAGLLFALDDAFVLPTAWLANRNSLLAVTFATAALGVHLERMARPRAGWALLEAVLCALALASGETAVGAFAYVVAYQVLGRAGPWRTRLVALAPTAAVLACFVGIYKVFHFGAAGSGTYVDPIGEPLEYLRELPARLSTMVGTTTVGLTADLWLTLPELGPVLIATGALAAVIWPSVGKFVWPRLTEDERAWVRWVGPATLLALLPSLATFPNTRLMLAPALGLALLVAQIARTAWDAQGARWSRRATLAWVGLAFVLQPLSAWLSQAGMLTQVGARNVAAVEGDHLRGRVVVLSTADFGPGVYGTAIRALQGWPSPTTWHVLSMVAAPHRLRRTAADRFELEPQGGRWLETVFELNFRKGRGFSPGQRVRLDGLSVTVLRVDDGKPTAIEVQLERPAEDYSFVAWDGRRLAPQALPELGAELTIAAHAPITRQLIAGDERGALTP